MLFKLALHYDLNLAVAAADIQWVEARHVTSGGESRCSLSYLSIAVPVISAIPYIGLSHRGIVQIAIHKPIQTCTCALLQVGSGGRDGPCSVKLPFRLSCMTPDACFYTRFNYLLSSADFWDCIRAHYYTTSLALGQNFNRILTVNICEEFVKVCCTNLR